MSSSGLIVRFLVAVLAFAALLVPIVLVLGAWQKAGLLRDRAAGLGQAGTLKWLRDAQYAPWHTWLAPAGAGLARVGLDAVAERLLAGVTQLHVAGPGTQLRAGDAIARVVVGDRQATLRAPVDSMVVAVNDEAERHPDLLHRDPYHRGWLAVVAPAAGGHAGLKTGEAARQWMADEERRLHLSFEHALGYAAADGGDLVEPTHGLLAPDQWEAIVHEFLDVKD